MNTQATKIKDFQVGDHFAHYGAVLKVTSTVRVWDDAHNEITDQPEKWTKRSCYGRKCEFVKAYNEGEVKYLGGLITGYDWMQGIEEVTYAKIVEESLQPSPVRALSLICLLFLGAAFASCSQTERQAGAMEKVAKAHIHQGYGTCTVERFVNDRPVFTYPDLHVEDLCLACSPAVNYGTSRGWLIAKIKPLSYGSFGYYYTKGDSIRYIQSSFNKVEVDTKWDGRIYGKNLVSR